jgi:hypothetical protein
MEISLYFQDGNDNVITGAPIIYQDRNVPIPSVGEVMVFKSVAWTVNRREFSYFTDDQKQVVKIQILLECSKIAPV